MRRIVSSAQRTRDASSYRPPPTQTHPNPPRRVWMSPPPARETATRRGRQGRRAGDAGTRSVLRREDEARRCGRRLKAEMHGPCSRGRGAAGLGSPSRRSLATGRDLTPWVALPPLARRLCLSFAARAVTPHWQASSPHPPTHPHSLSLSPHTHPCAHSVAQARAHAHACKRTRRCAHARAPYTRAGTRAGTQALAHAQARAHTHARAHACHRSIMRWTMRR